MDTTKAELQSRTASDAATITSDSRTVAEAGAPTPASNLPGSPADIRDHELIRRIGQGSYGEVWLARNVMGTYRAVKIVYRASFEHERPFEREFHGIQRFEPLSRSHEGFVDILQVGRAAEHFYYIMELGDDVNAGQQIDPNRYEPKTLRGEVQARRRLPFERCVEIGLSLAQALGRLHEHGLIHRDIKPSNIIFVDGQPKLADIGLVAEQSEAKSFVGTEGFIPPEGPGTPQADIYSLGKVLYEMATGKDRHEFPTLPTLLGESETDTHLLELNTVFLKACQSDIKQRYQTCEQMRDDLLLLRSGKSVKHAQTVEQRLRLLAKLSMAGIFVTVLVTAAFIWSRRQTTREAALRARAEAGERSALQNEFSAQRNLYAADMLLAQRALEDSNSGRAVELLERYTSTPELQKLRGWEWRYLWDQTRSDATWVAQGHPRTIHSMAVSSDGNLLATGGNEGTVVIWDLKSRTKIKTLVRTNVISSLTFSQTNVLAATEDNQSRVWLWDLAGDFAQLPAIQTDSDAYCVGFSSNGEMMAVGTAGELSVWDRKTWRRTQTISGSSVMCVVFAPNTELLAYAQADGLVALWSLRDRRVVSSDSRGSLRGPARSLAFSPDTKWLAKAGMGPHVADVWAVEGMVLSASLTNHHEWISSVSFSRDGRLLATGSADQSVKIWTVGDWKESFSLRGHMDEVWKVAFSPTDDVLITGDKVGFVRAWNATPPKREQTELKFNSQPRRLLLGHHGQYAATITGDDELRSLDLSSGTEIPLTRILDHNPRWDFGRQDRRIALLLPDGQIKLFDTTSGELQRTIQAAALPGSPIALSPDGSLLALQDANHCVGIYDADTGSLRATLPRIEWPVARLVFSGDGGLLAVALDRAYAAEVWNWGEGRRVSLMEGHRAPISQIVFLPDHSTMATGSLDATARLWEINSGNLLTTFSGQLTAIYALAASPDRTRLAGSGGDGVIRLWDLDSRQEVGAIKSGHQRIDGLAFSSDASVLVSSSSGGVRFWRAPNIDKITIDERNAASRSK